jgi:hypothetical protein
MGGRTILEYWIPAEDLAEFNANIVGLIEVVAEYRLSGSGRPGLTRIRFMAKFQHLVSYGLSTQVQRTLVFRCR